MTDLMQIAAELDRLDLVVTARSGLPILPALDRVPEVYVIYTPEGIPRWFGPQPVAGCVKLDMTELVPLLAEGVGPEALATLHATILTTHRRLPDGTWVMRDPPPPPTPEEIAAQLAEIERQAQEAEAEAKAARERWVDDEVFRRSGPAQLLRMGGKITIAEFNTRVAAIRAAVEAEI